MGPMDGEDPVDEEARVGRVGRNSTAISRTHRPAKKSMSMT